MDNAENQTEAESIPLMDRRDARVNQIVFMYYTQHQSIRSISRAMGIAKTQVHRYLLWFRRSHIKELKRDFRTHRKLFEYMVSLLVQSDHRRIELWKHYRRLNREYRAMYKRILDCPDLLHNDKLCDLVDDRLLKMKLKIIRGKSNLLSQLRQESLLVLSALYRFGLTGHRVDRPQAPKGKGVAQTTETDFDLETAVEEIKDFIGQMAVIITQEVENPEQRTKIFTQLQAEMDKAKFLHKDEEEEITEVIV